MEYLWFIVGLILIIKGGDYFVDASVSIAKRFHVSEIIIGATIVSIGTTLPEVMVSVSSAMKGFSSISYGNAIGSIICNTALICAISIVCKPMSINREAMVIPTAFFFISSLLYVMNVWAFGRLDRLLGAILLVVFVVYTVQNVIFTKKHLAVLNKRIDIKPKKQSDTYEKSDGRIFFDVMVLLVSAIVITVGADLMVDNGVIIARNLHVPETVIALTMIAVGTSLPELTTAITSLVKGHSSLSLGNIIGANLFNIVWVSGLSIVIAPFDLPKGKMIFNTPSSLLIDIPLMFLTMVILTMPALKYGKVSRWQGAVLLILYISYLAFQFLY